MNAPSRFGRPLRVLAASGLLLLVSPLAATTIGVSTLTDDFTVNGNCTLREALHAAEHDVAVDQCPAGEPAVADLVVLDAGIHVLTLGPLSIGGGAVTVRGRLPAPFGPSVVSGQQASRILNVAGEASVVLHRLHLIDGDAGTGPEGEGGAIRAESCRLELLSVLARGNRAARGGAIAFAGNAQHALLVRLSTFRDNVATGSNQSVGGALRLELAGGASAAIVDSSFDANRADSSATGGSTAGAAIWATLGGLDPGPGLEVRRTAFTGNRVACADGTQGDGALYVIANDGTVRVTDSTFTANDAEAGCHSDSTTALAIYAGAGRIVADRLRLIDEDAGELRHHVLLSIGDEAEAEVSNLLLADGPSQGIDAQNTGVLRLGHLTVTGHAQRSILLRTLDAAATTTLENSILWGNGNDAPTVQGPALLRANLIGVDPNFLDPAAGDYRLTPGSPAIGAGNRTLPTVRLADAAHAGRVRGAQTDAGAYEWGGLFADDHELGDATDWSRAWP